MARGQRHVHRDRRDERQDRLAAEVPRARATPAPSTTAGNLVFVGRNAGQLQAYDATNGKRLWSFQTGAGANNTATIFQQNGKEYVAVPRRRQLARRRRRTATTSGSSASTARSARRLHPERAPASRTRARAAAMPQARATRRQAQGAVFAEQLRLVPRRDRPRRQRRPRPDDDPEREDYSASS